MRPSRAGKHERAKLKGIDITGVQFGRLIVLGRDFDRVETHRKGQYTSHSLPNWICQCSCGKVRSYRKYQLTHGEIVSCGCYRNERNRSDKNTIRKAKNQFYLAYVFGAKKRRLEFTLSKEQAISLAEEACFYCGALPSGDSWPHNGIDRKYNDLGYVPGNMVPCCSFCNRAKWTIKPEEFIARCKAVAMHCSSDWKAANA